MLPVEIRETLDEGDFQEIWKYTPHTDLEVPQRATLRKGLRFTLGYEVFPPLNFTSHLLRRCMQGLLFWWMDTRDEDLKETVKEMLFDGVEPKEAADG